MKQRITTALVFLLVISCASVISSSGASGRMRANSPMNPGRLNTPLLEQTLIQYTNEARKKHGLPSCEFDQKLRLIAFRHSREMVVKKFFSHQSPTPKNATMRQRFENGGLPLINRTIGENIAVDYFLNIANRPFFAEKRNGKTVYVDAETRKIITNQSYRQFARSMVHQWMNSPGHRKNILNKEFDRIGIGVYPGIYKGFPAIYTTQNFMGDVSPR